MEYQKVSSPLLSKKLTDFHSITGKSVYDGVFAAPLTVGSRMKEEYSDIFGASGASSIPVLDVPEPNERKVSVDVRSSTLDYSSIFGGFGEFDSAVSHEELFSKPKKKDNRHEKSRSPAEAGSCTSNFQVENQEVSNNPAYQSFDRAKKFKMSYLKTSQGSTNGTNGTTHIAQLNAIPGFTCLIDEVAPSQFTEAEKPLSTGLNDTVLDLNFDGGNMGNINAELIQPGDAIKQAHRGGSKFRSKTNRSRSNSKEILFDAYKIDLRTQASKVKPPSSQPHNLACQKDDFERSTTSKTGVYESHFGENAAGFSSPPYFGEEVDTNSAAAASAAAVKKAIEEAQARIEIARGIMERKKKGEKHVKPRCCNVSKAEERRDDEIEDKGNTYNEEARKKFGKVGHTMSVHTMPRTNSGSNVGHVTPDFREREELFVIKKASGGMNAKEHNSTPVDCKLEKEDREAERWEDSGTEIVQPVSKCEPEEEKYISKKTFVKAEENIEKIDAVEEEHKTEAEWTFNFNVIKGTCLFNECANTTNSDQQNSDQEAYGNSLRLLGETSMTCKALHEVECGKTELIGVREIPENGKKLEVHDHRDDVCKGMKIKKVERGWYANQKQQEGESEKEEAETMSAVHRQREQCEIGKEELSHNEENGINDGAAYNKVDFVKQQKETCWMEETEERVEDTHRTNAAEKTSGREQVWEKDEVTVDKFCEEDQNEGKFEECVDGGVEEKLMDTEKNEKLNKGTCKETEKREETYECNEITQDSCELSSNNSEAADDVFTLDQIKIPSDTWETSGDEDCDEYLDAPTNEENGEITEVPLASFHSKEMKTELNAVAVADREEEKEIFKAEVASLPQEFLELYEIKGQVDSTVATLAFECNEISLGYTNKDVSQKQYDQLVVESRTFCNQEQHVDEFVHESEENFKDVNDSEVTSEQGDDEVDPKFSYEERLVDNEETVEEIQRPTVSTGEEETENIADKDKTSQNHKENKENHDRTPTSQETEAKCGSQNRVEPEKEPVRKIDETKEKGREKEKERIAVERAIREARERAFAEARERAAAEKANAEARRRAMAEARERLDKGSEEAKGKFSTEKASIEARLKAERAAVERATAEARKRALEKAMSEKARNQGAKDSAASRNNGVRQSFSFNDSQYKGSGSHQSSGYPNSCSNDVNVESAQRHKAKLERHQRTAERAAKALAEKNMRDLLAQKEQQEKNRLAEALDADVKRWSSGKEGNLRALLSTLQYILGPDSGWQPVPLTELIATTAVKKAYRRATLFVHPDKLQQRGATIQQKYICEKVFDLLKEAWNKFSKEER